MSYAYIFQRDFVDPLYDQYPKNKPKQRSMDFRTNHMVCPIEYEKVKGGICKYKGLEEGDFYSKRSGSYEPERSSYQKNGYPFMSGQNFFYW